MTQQKSPNNHFAKTIYTIGHGTRSWDEFQQLLDENGIRIVVDIRRFPGSRHNPQFSQQTMMDALTQHNIGYIHLPELGGRRPVGKNSHNTTWRNTSFRGYADYMETDAFALGIDRLIAIAGQSRSAMMCSETVWWRCHRSMVSDYLLSLGWDVRHIVGRGDVKPHHYTEPARIVDGKLTYHPADVALSDSSERSLS